MVNVCSCTETVFSGYRSDWHIFYLKYQEGNRLFLFQFNTKIQLTELAERWEHRKAGSLLYRSHKSRDHLLRDVVNKDQLTCILPPSASTRRNPSTTSGTGKRYQYRNWFINASRSRGNLPDWTMWLAKWKWLVFNNINDPTVSK